jgi:hypothetical protein
MLSRDLWSRLPKAVLDAVVELCAYIANIGESILNVDHVIPHQAYIIVQQGVDEVEVDEAEVDEAEVDEAEVDEAILGEHSDLLDHIDTLHAPEIVTLLDEKEIAQYQKTIAAEEHDSQLSLQKKLDDYQRYVAESCPISMVDIRELKQSQLLSIKVHDVEGRYDRAYDLGAMKAYIHSCTLRRVLAEDMFTKRQLTDEKAVQFYRGYDPSMVSFIRDVRAVNEWPKRLEIREKRLAYYKKLGVFKEASVALPALQAPQTQALFQARK